jgi:hypothetical protein
LLDDVAMFVRNGNAYGMKGNLYPKTTRFDNMIGLRSQSRDGITPGFFDQGSIRSYEFQRSVVQWKDAKAKSVSTYGRDLYLNLLPGSVGRLPFHDPSGNDNGGRSGSQTFQNVPTIPLRTHI